MEICPHATYIVMTILSSRQYRDNAKQRTKTKVIIQLDKSLIKWYLKDDESNIMVIRLTVAINVAAIA